MPKGLTTRDARRRRSPRQAEAAPGLLLVFSVDRPLYHCLPCSEAELVIGRDSFVALAPEDPVMSRRHVAITAAGDTWTVQDLDSRNGTFVDGKRIKGKWTGARPRVISAGETVLLAVADLTPFRGATVRVTADQVCGPQLARVLERIAELARTGDSLHVVGESGAGKELAVRAFHAERDAERPLIAVNCAAIPEALAERLFFGSKKGAYSGATESEGYVQAAEGGTLFLDEVAELAAPVQAKLLRVLENREVVPLGANTARKVALRIISASHRPLDEEVAAGHFRQDLYYRMGRPAVEVPPLRDRPEEIPFLIRHELGRLQARQAPHASFVEACLLRPWPGNVRELLLEVRAAVSAAAGSEFLDAEHLDEAAGAAAAAQPAPNFPDRATIEAALRRHQSISAAARELGLHRTQLRRWLGRHPDLAALVRARAE